MFVIVGVLLISFLFITGFSRPGCSPLSIEKMPSLEEISAKEAYEIIQKNKNNSNFVIIDVRTPEEYESGHIENAINIDFYSDNFKDELKKLDKNKNYLVYCRSGNRSGSSLEIMEELGFKEAYHISGGISEWKSEGFPIVVD